MTEPLSNEELRLGERLAAHLDAIPLEEPSVIARSVAVGAAEARPPRHGRDALLVLMAAAVIVGGIGAAAIGAIRLGVVADTVVLPPGPSLPTPPFATPKATESENLPSGSAPVALENGNVLIGYGGRVFLTDPTGVGDPYELPGPDLPDWSPQWSPDGNRILVLNGSVDGEPDLALWIMGPEGRSAEQLTGTANVPVRHVQDPAWSPDGTRIAMYGEAGGRSGIYVLDITSRTIVADLTDAPRPMEPAWSPDGARIAVRIGEGRIGVWNIDDGSVTVVAETDTVSRPAWGRDGSVLFSEFMDAGTNHFRAALFVVPPDGGAPRQLTDPGDGRLDSEAAVSPDGRSVVFLRQDQLGASSNAVCCGTITRSLETGEERLLGEYPGATWSPDGHWIAAGAVDPAVAPKDPTSMKTEWVAVRVSDGEERLLLVRNALGGPTVGPNVSWGPRSNR
jgi:Tol biopolymer transport system component